MMPKPQGTPAGEAGCTGHAVRELPALRACVWLRKLMQHVKSAGRGIALCSGARSRTAEASLRAVTCRPADLRAPRCTCSFSEGRFWAAREGKHRVVLEYGRGGRVRAGKSPERGRTGSSGLPAAPGPEGRAGAAVGDSGWSLPRGARPGSCGCRQPRCLARGAQGDKRGQSAPLRGSG